MKFSRLISIVILSLALVIPNVTTFDREDDIWDLTLLDSNTLEDRDDDIWDLT